MFNLPFSCIFGAMFFLSAHLFSQDIFTKTDTSILKNEPVPSPILPDLRPKLKNLSEAEKLRSLELLRLLGGNPDDEITHLFEKLGPEAKQKFLLHLESLQPEKPPRTTVEWNFLEIDLGQVEEGRIVSDSLVVKNTGQNPYEITSFQSKCDCTVAEKPEFPVMPGESRAVHFEFNSLGKIGVFKIAVVLHDNSSPNARAIVYLKGLVTPRKRW